MWLRGANLAATLLQVVYAVAIGLMYAALALRTQTILPLIVTHGLTDFFGYLALNSTVVTTGLSTLVYIVTAGEIHHLHCVQCYPDASDETAGVRGRNGGNVHATARTGGIGLRSTAHGMGSLFPNAA